MKRKILKAVGYIMLAIGIIGGLSTIEMIFNGNLAIWIILVVCFCGIGIISLSASNGVNNKDSVEVDAESYRIHDSQKVKTNKTQVYNARNVMLFFNSIREYAATMQHLYIKMILTIIAILLGIIALELNKMAEISYVLWKIYTG